MSRRSGSHRGRGCAAPTGTPRSALRPYYNLSVTGLSVLVALLVGGVEIGQSLAERLDLRSSVWGWLRGVELGRLGLMFVALFAIVWLISWGAWRRLQPDIGASARAS